MAVVTSGSVAQSAGGLVLTFTDTSTGIGTLTSRTLTVYDCNGNILVPSPFSMGTSTTQAFDITADGWYRFYEVIVDNTGTYPLTVDFYADAVYKNAFSNAMVAVSSYQSDLFGVIWSLNLSQDYYNAGYRFFIGGFSVAAQNMITQANFYVNTPYYAQ